MKQMLIVDVPDEQNEYALDTVKPRVDKIQLWRNQDDSTLCLTTIVYAEQWKTQINMDKQLVQLLHGPRIERRRAEDDTHHDEGFSHNKCEHKLEFTLQLLHATRQYGMQDAHWHGYRPLDKTAMNRALHWLNAVHRGDYVTRTGLGQALNKWDSGARFDSRSKNQMQSDLRSGFRTSLRDIVGDATIAYAILRYGYSSPAALTGIVREVFDAQQKHKYNEKMHRHRRPEGRIQNWQRPRKAQGVFVPKASRLPRLSTTPIGHINTSTRRSNNSIDAFTRESSGENILLPTKPLTMAWASNKSLSIKQRATLLFWFKRSSCVQPQAVQESRGSVSPLARGRVKQRQHVTTWQRSCDKKTACHHLPDVKEEFCVISLRTALQIDWIDWVIACHHLLD